MLTHSQKSTAFAVTSWATGSQNGARIYYRTGADPGPAGQLGYLTSDANPSDPNSYVTWNDNKAAIATTLHPLTKIATANSFGMSKVGSPAFFQASDGRIVSWCNDAGSDAWNNLNVPATSTVAGTGIAALSFGNSTYTEYSVFFTDSTGNIYEVRRTSADSAWKAPVSISYPAVAGAHLAAVAWTQTTGKCPFSSRLLFFVHLNHWTNLCTFIRRSTEASLSQILHQLYPRVTLEQHLPHLDICWCHRMGLGVDQHFRPRPLGIQSGRPSALSLPQHEQSYGQHLRRVGFYPFGIPG
jgi:hypothetical protein